MTTLQSGDLMDISEDLGGSYGSRSLTYSNLLTNLNSDLAIPTVGATQYQVPYVNAGATDFAYSANLTYDGSTMTLVSPLLINTNNELRLGSNTANYNALKSPTGMGSNLTYTLPSAYPTSTGQVLASTTTGTMSWTDNTEPVVKIVDDLTGLTDALTAFNAASQGGIIKLGANIPLSANQEIDFGVGIEIWGGGFGFTLASISIDSGTTTSTTADKLVDSGQNFLTTVSVGDKVTNTSAAPDDYAYVTAVDSDTTLSLSHDIITTGQAYTISSTAKIIVKGSRGTFRNVAFTGITQLNSTSKVDSQQCIEIDDGSFSVLKIIECRFNDIIGSTTGISNVYGACPFQIKNCGSWTIFEFLFFGIGSATSSGTTKYQTPMSVFWTPAGKSGTRLVFKDFYNNSPEGNSISTRFTRYRDSLKVGVYGATSTSIQNQVIYDETLTIDSASTWPDMDLYPNMYGPSTVVTSNDPTAVATYGVPGDVVISGSTIYMKHTDIGTNTNWKTI
tara:strand:- start:3984 stop:5498 length:1515 start_codon:yes stop_codon:yes gene_type:complete